MITVGVRSRQIMPKWSTIYPILSKIPRPILESPLFLRAASRLATETLRLYDRLHRPKYLNAVRWAVTQVRPEENLNRFIDAHLRFLVNFHLRTFELAKSSDPYLLSPNVRFDLTELEKARENGNGVLLPSSHIGVPLEMLFAPIPGEKALVLSQEIPLVREICSRADDSWELITLEQGGVGSRIKAALKKGKAVIVNTDFCDPHTKVEIVRTFGTPAPVASGAFTIAKYLNCPVVPLLIACNQPGLHLTALSARYFNSNSTSSINNMMQDVQLALESHISNYATQWLGWAYLPLRWKQGQN